MDTQREYHDPAYGAFLAVAALAVTVPAALIAGLVWWLA